MTLVVDASVVVAAALDAGAAGQWAESVLLSGQLAAPHHMVVEASNVIRRAALAGDVSPDAAALAHGDILNLPVSLFPFAPYAVRVWELRENVTAYDAAYVALAESLDVRLATLDERLSRATGPHCTFWLPE